jgi:hypothetical protein
MGVTRFGKLFRLRAVVRLKPERNSMNSMWSRGAWVGGSRE